VVLLKRVMEGLTWWVVGCAGARPTRHNISRFRGGLHNQSLDWYWQTKQYRI